MPNLFNQSDHEDKLRKIMAIIPTRPTTQTPPPPANQQARAKVAFAAIPEKKGQRVVLYGTGGIGKTTLACLLEDAAFIDLDESLPILKKQLKEIGAPIPKVAQASNWQEVRNVLQADGWDSVKNIIIDTATKLEEFAVAHTLKTVKRENGGVATGVEDYGYGKGYQFVFDSFLPILGDLDRHVRAGRNVILIAHECTANVPNPGGENFIRYEPRLQSPASGKASIRLRIKEWADHVLFLSYDIAVDKKGKAQGSGTRTLYSAELPSFMAKSRTTDKQFDVAIGDATIWDNILK